MCFALTVWVSAIGLAGEGKTAKSRPVKALLLCELLYISYHKPKTDLVQRRQELMAKQKAPVSKSALIREYLKGNRKAPAKEVVEALAAKGITVTEGLVYMQKGKLKGKRQRRAKVIRAARAAQATSNGNPVVLIRDVRALAVRAGGYKMLKELVEALGE
jgi:hypothetical protein